MISVQCVAEALGAIEELHHALDANVSENAQVTAPDPSPVGSLPDEHRASPEI